MSKKLTGGLLAAAFAVAAIFGWNEFGREKSAPPEAPQSPAAGVSGQTTTTSVGTEPEAALPTAEVAATETAPSAEAPVAETPSPEVDAAATQGETAAAEGEPASADTETAAVSTEPEEAPVEEAEPPAAEQPAASSPATPETETPAETAGAEVEAPAVAETEQPAPVGEAQAETETPPATAQAETETPAGAETEAEAQETPATAAAETEAETEAAATPEITTEEQPEGALRFDVVRVDQGGQMIIAGTARPGERVEILLDGEVIGEAVADNGGAFATVLFTQLTGEAQQLQLRVLAEEDVATAAAETDTGPASEAEPVVEPESETSTADPAATQPDPEPSVASVEVAATEPEPAEAKASIVEAEPEVAATIETPSETSPPVAEAEPETAAPAGDAEGAATEVAATESESAPVSQDPEPSETPAETPAVTAEADPAPAETPEVEPETLELASADPEPEPLSTDPGWKVSAPVIILPPAAGDEAPALVQPQEDGLALVQPRGGDVRGVILDSVTYGETGDVQFNGRGRTERVIRIYGNMANLGSTPVAADGTWAWALSKDRAEPIKLFRFDEIDATGAVTSRIETPFEYSSVSPQVLRERRVVIQRGDVLWRIAEQFYGEGIRYSLIFRANDELIRDPDLIYPGQVFSIPELVDAE